MPVKNLALALSGGRTMAAAVFGRGEKPLVLLPGLGDGLRTVKGGAAAFALSYRTLAEGHTVYFLSRANELVERVTTRQMAADTAEAMELLGLAGADVAGVSQGGMIAQWLAVDRPDLVDRLVLTVTAARPNALSAGSLDRWLALAEAGDYRELMIDTAENTYTPAYLRKLRLAYPLLTRIGKPRDFTRFRLQAAAARAHDAFDRLSDIRCPTLVQGASEDRVVGPEASREIAGTIPDSTLYMYEGYGHAVYEEARDWQRRTAEFLNKK